MRTVWSHEWSECVLHAASPDLERLSTQIQRDVSSGESIAGSRMIPATAAGTARQLAFVAACGCLFLAACGRGSQPTFPGSPVVLISIDTLRADHLPAYGHAGG